MATNDGGPAFPCGDGPDMLPNPGMNLRDYFAANAPPMPVTMLRDAEKAAYERSSGAADRAEELYGWLLAKWNYRYADAMLRVRAGPGPVPKAAKEGDNDGE